MSKLFTPHIELGLKNRAVMAPMTRCACLPNGNPTPELAEYYIRRAKNEVGLIIIESAAINDSTAIGYGNGLQFHNEKHIEAWRPIVKKIQEAGAKVWIQLYHAGRLTVKELANGSPVAPSPIKTWDNASYWRPEQDGQIINFQTKTPYLTPKELDQGEINEVISQFAHACAFAEKAGFDGVELHGAHGYLLHQFLHSETNKRTDHYNAKSLKFVEELVTKCRNSISNSFTLCYRLSLHMVDNSFIRYDEKELDYAPLVQLLDKNGIDVFHSSELKAASPAFGHDLALCEVIRENTKKPIITCGRISKLKTAEKLLDSKKADLVAFGRSLISNPELIANFKNNVDHDFVKFNYDEHWTPLY